MRFNYADPGGFCVWRFPSHSLPHKMTIDHNGANSRTRRTQAPVSKQCFRQLKPTIRPILPHSGHRSRASSNCAASRTFRYFDPGQINGWTLAMPSMLRILCYSVCCTLRACHMAPTHFGTASTFCTANIEKRRPCFM